MFHFAHVQAHLDNVPDEMKTIDGAKGKWCNLLLLDAMIYLLKNDQFVGNSRRHFNQYIMLYECIMEELRLTDTIAFNEIMSFKRLETLALHAKKESESDAPASVETRTQRYSNITVSELTYPWNNMAELHLSLQHGPPSKAKNKFIVMTDVLTNHEYFQKYSHNLKTIIDVIMSKSILVFNSHKKLNTEISPRNANNVAEVLKGFSLQHPNKLQSYTERKPSRKKKFDESVSSSEPSECSDESAGSSAKKKRPSGRKTKLAVACVTPPTPIADNCPFPVGVTYLSKAVLPSIINTHGVNGAGLLLPLRGLPFYRDIAAVAAERAFYDDDCSFAEWDTDVSFFNVVEDSETGTF